MFQGTTGFTFIRNADGTVGRKPAAEIASTALSVEDKVVLDTISARLDMNLSDVAAALESTTVTLSSLVGVKNIVGGQINPSTEDKQNTLIAKFGDIGQNASASSVSVVLSSDHGVIPVSGTIAISGSVAVTGTFWQATQPVSGPLTNTELRATPVPVSGTVTATGPLTDTQLRASSVPVSGPLTDTELRAASVPVSGPLTDTQLRAVAVPVSGPLTDTQIRATALPVSGPLTDTQLRAVSVPVSGPLTDAQLRATPVAISGSITATGGLTDTELRATPVPVSGTVAVTGTFWQATQPISGSVSVSNLPASQAVTGTFWQATQPVSGTVTATGPLTDLELRATAVPVSGSFWQSTQPISGTVSVSNFPASQAVTGTFWQATQPVSGTVAVSGSVAVTGPLTDTELRATAVPVSGTFWQATQPVSIATMPTTPVTGTFFQATQPVSIAASVPVTGPLTDTELRATSVPVSGTIAVSNFPASQAVTGTFFQATQPVSIASMPTTPVTGTFWQATQPVSGPLTDTQLRASAVPVASTESLYATDTYTTTNSYANARPIQGDMATSKLRTKEFVIKNTGANTARINVIGSVDGGTNYDVFLSSNTTLAAGNTLSVNSTRAYTHIRFEAISNTPGSPTTVVTRGYAIGA